MKMKIMYDDDVGQPKVKMNEEGTRITEIIIEAPFILTDKAIHDGPDDQTIPVHARETKPCTRCGKDKTREEYHHSATSTTGVQSLCSKCKQELAVQRKKAKEEKRAKWEEEKKANGD